MGSGLVQPRQGIHNPLLNSGAAVVQCKVSKPSDLRVSLGLQADSNLSWGLVVNRFSAPDMDSEDGVETAECLQ